MLDGGRRKLVGGTLSGPARAEHGRRAWFVMQALRSSQSGGTYRQLPRRLPGSRTGLVLHSDKPRAHAGSRRRAALLPTGAGNGGARREAIRADGTPTVLRAIPRKAAGKIAVEAIEAEAKVRAEAGRVRSRTGAGTTGSELENVLPVDEPFEQWPAHGPERV